MPGMSGTEFVGAAKAGGATCGFLVISGHGALGEQRSGVDGFLPKPLDVREMLREVERLFASRAGRVTRPNSG